MAKKKIDPLNKKQYGAVSAMLTVSDIPAAVSFYQKAFGFTKRGVMNGPDGKPIHAELTLRGTTLMLGPENSALGKRTAKSIGASPASLFIYAENADKVVSKALNLGATGQGPVMDMFWGDRCGTIVDPDGYTWMVGTHKAEPTVKEIKEKMLEQMRQQPPVLQPPLEPGQVLSASAHGGTGSRAKPNRPEGRRRGSALFDCIKTSKSAGCMRAIRTRTVWLDLIRNTTV